MDQIAGADKHPSLLLVDDDEMLRAVLARALERRSFKVTVAHDYRSALAAAAANPPECAVVDLKLPGGSGLNLVKRLVNLRARVGAHYYLTKPAGADAIVAALHHRDPGRSRSPTREKPLSVNRLEWEHINQVLTGNAQGRTSTPNTSTDGYQKQGRTTFSCPCF
jgi:two-component system response regulator RegA